MRWKYALRTARNAVFRGRPYLAHLAITHRCNLRCRFCHIPEERFDELDLEGMKRAIDVLDRLRGAEEQYRRGERPGGGGAQRVGPTCQGVRAPSPGAWW